MSERLEAEHVDRLFREYRRNRRRNDRNALVETHIGFARHIARRFADRGIASDDLNQIALLALVKAVDRFDPDVGVAFTSFAGPTIQGEVKRYFRDASWAVRVPRSAKELHLAIRSATDELTGELRRSPTVKELAGYLDVSTDQTVEAMGTSAAFAASSIDAVSSEDEDGSSNERWLADTDDDLANADDRLLFERLIRQLPDREQQIIRMRFFDELTQAEIAERVDMSQMHVSPLLRRSFQRMQQSRRGIDESTDVKPTG